MPEKLEIALAYQQHGFKVYPLAANSRTPLKGSHGYKDATTNHEQAKAWWRNHPEYNIGIGLDSVLVFDIDRGHRSGSNGSTKLRELVSTGRISRLPSTYTESTPSGGLHIFYSYDKTIKLTSRANLFSTGDEVTGLDYTALGVPVYPSTRNGGMYRPLKGHKITQIAPAPQWLLEEIQQVNRPSPSFGSVPFTGKKWSGKLLDELVHGTSEGNRNSFLTRLAGKLFFTGAEPETVYNLMLSTNNDYLDESLSEIEVNKIFKSVLRAEVRRRSVG